MSVYTVRLYGGGPPPGSQSIYTVPTGYTAVVRDIDVCVATPGSAIVVTFAVYQVQFWQHAFTTAGGSAQWVGRQAMTAGEVLNVSSTAGGWYVLVTGYLFEGGPPPTMGALPAVSG